MTRPTVQTSRMQTLLVVAVAVAALYFARAMLIPIALAALVSLLLTPVVARLERRGLHPVAAAVLVVSLSFILLLALAWILTLQVTDLAEKLPDYRRNIVEKAASLGPAGEYVGRAYATLQRLGEEMVTSTMADAAAPVAAPVPSVRVVEPGLTTIEVVREIVLTVLSTVGSAAVVFLLIAFLLIYRRDLGDRLVQMFGGSQVSVTHHTMSHAAENVSRYLLLQSAINACFGAVLTLGLVLLGVPNALLWGLLAALLRFVPYVGFWIGITLPVLLSLAVFPGWTRPIVLLVSAGLFDAFVGNVVEPWIYGTRTVVSPLGVVLGAMFWTWLWGPAGLILAVPMTVSAVVLGRAIPQLRFLDTLFGSETVIEPRAQLYHRLLGLDADAAVDLVDAHRKDKALVEVCDSLLIPALALAEEDRHSGGLDDERAAALAANLRVLLEDIDDEAAAPGVRAEAGPLGPALPETPPATPRVFILPAADEADEAVGVMLAKCLAAQGFASEVGSVRTTSGEKVTLACEHPDAVFCISALPPGASAPSRYLFKRIRARCPRARIVIGRWGAAGDAAALSERVVPGGNAVVVATIAAAIERIRDAAATAQQVQGAAPRPSGAPATGRS